MDTLGRYLFVKGQIGQQIYTFANVYLPNLAKVSYLEWLMPMVEEFAEGILILGCDFNLTLEPGVDASGGSWSI